MKAWRWVQTILVTAVVIAAFLTLRWWLVLLLSFVGANTDLIQGLDSLINLVRAVGSTLALVFGLWSGVRRASARPTVEIEVGESQDGRAGAGLPLKITVRDPAGEQIAILNPELLMRAALRRTDDDLRPAVEAFLGALVTRYQYLDFKGMGVTDRLALRIPLLEMYVPLRARVELPEGDAWPRELRLAGRKLAEQDGAAGPRLSEPRPVLELLREHRALIVLGDPGAGKTTFLKYLALTLSTGGAKALGLEVRLPVLVPLSAYAAALDEGDVRLDDFVCQYFHDLGADLPLERMIGQALHEGGALILLDGLDEVRDPNLRQTVMQHVEAFYAFHRKAGNCFVLTSRIIGYREVRASAEGLLECTLVDLEEDEIAEFCARWTAALERAARGETRYAEGEGEREREDLLRAIHANPGVCALAANPLLLTILALIKRQGVALPDRRVELYDIYVRALLSSWNRVRGLGWPPTGDLDVVETVRVLAPLALWMHETNPGAGLVRGGDLLRRIEALYRERGQDDPERAARQFLSDVRRHSGLLLERGAGQYGFIHLTFEEYLAAIGVARLGQRRIGPIVDALARHVGDPAWREVALLTVGYLGIVQGMEEIASDVVNALLNRAPGEPGQAAVLMGEAVADAQPGGVTLGCAVRVRRVLLRTMRDDRHVAPWVRAAAGDALARLGDPRPEALDPDAMVFCHVPAGPFWMGSGEDDPDAYDDERPRHQVNLRYDYWIGRYPVTVAQFRAYLQATGRAPEYSHSLQDPGNRPVRWVNWHEARAFCAWLTDRWRQERILPEGWAVHLPSEAEWEKAARGGLQVPIRPRIAPANRRPWSAPGRIEMEPNPTPARRYPWGDQADPHRANYRESGIGNTSAVGCFPGGASPYGSQEVSGTLWEWTRSLWGPDVSRPQFRYPYDPSDGRENEKAGDEVARVVRGGAFDFDRVVARCSYRFRDLPNGVWYGLGFRCVVSPISPALRSGPSAP